ncbi:hemerythrin domain-containing protein [Mucilaginibacter sp. L3T2-6]|uniref:hemerythrin domain-containing protein n=1 Tax=Mucilaginibacter sp. L3T2-6 TaxID=3062491 RepID=UPI002676C354|nr:hemerythrin domain-containing protein [Mucilaginibacter sp. L3T2-6]MDO3644860.1 hemerythrin domain-containing protein [Mucilaginibacter sp. L3T2-6]MDV6217246.1 hemerythrin domain-containing protein [Mucilaginibacter sp. L3T2-6]
MKTQEIIPAEGGRNFENRRNFLTKTGLLIASGIGVTGFLGSCGGEKGGDEDVTTNEDLMREHGVLKRILLIYDEASSRLTTGKDLNLSLVGQAATLIKTFVEDYHEKLEEDHLFPRFEKAGQLADLTKTLRIQHQKGRILTGRIITNAKKTNLTSDDKKAMAQDMQAFVRMYSPHEAREDTVLFPALHKIISKHEYDSLGEDFEKKEKEQFGGDGFDMAVDKVTEIEKGLNIYDLNLFTPNV